LLDNTKWHVTRNLYTALSHLRKLDEDVTIWIDALALNQSDISEQNVQVSEMRNIYSQACSTFIWLCDADHEVDVDVEAYFAASHAWFTANADWRSEMEETYKRSIADDDGIGWLFKKMPSSSWTFHTGTKHESSKRSFIPRIHASNMKPVRRLTRHWRLLPQKGVTWLTIWQPQATSF